MKTVQLKNSASRNLKAFDYKIYPKQLILENPPSRAVLEF